MWIYRNNEEEEEEENTLEFVTTQCSVLITASSLESRLLFFLWDVVLLRR